MKGCHEQNAALDVAFDHVPRQALCQKIARSEIGIDHRVPFVFGNLENGLGLEASGGGRVDKNGDRPECITGVREK